jgi:hypothetical protein
VSGKLIKAIADMGEEEVFRLVKEMVEGGSESMAILDAAGTDCMPNHSTLGRLPILGKLRVISRAWQPLNSTSSYQVSHRRQHRRK